MVTAQRGGRAERAALIPAGATVVTYCWVAECHGATRAALAFACLGYPVKELIGGYEYWVREGYPMQPRNGVNRREADKLAAPPGAISCAC